MKFFKKIFEQIKNKFIKKEETSMLLDKSIVIEEKDNVCLLSEIKVGDVIWAKRYKNEEEMNLIEEGHREGPFIVVALDKNGLICSKGTSVEINEKKLDLFFNLSNSSFIVEKDTNFRLRNFVLIDESTYINKLGTLDKENFSFFMKSLKMAIKFNKNIEEEETFDLELDLSDIIVIDDKKYIVLDINENKIKCILFENYKTNLEMKDLKNLDYSKIVELDKNTKYKIIDKLNNNVLKYLLTKEREYLENILNQKIIQRGSVVSKKNKKYYVYGEDGQDLLVFEITGYKDLKTEEIYLNGKRYYSNFEDLKFKRGSDVCPLFLCSSEDINNIKKQRKNYIETEKKNEEYERTPHLRLNVGEIIESKKLKKKRFIIISIKPKTYECLSIYKIMQGIYEPLLIRKEDTIISKNKSIEGIKWLEENPGFKMEKIGNTDVINRIFNTQIKYLENKNKEKMKETILDRDDRLKIGMIVKKDIDNNETFVIKNIVGNLVECISYVDRNSKNTQSHFFNKDSVIIVAEKQKRK